MGREVIIVNMFGRLFNIFCTPCSDPTFKIVFLHNELYRQNSAELDIFVQILEC